jgi:integrase
VALFSLLFFHGLRASEPGTLTYNDYVRGPDLGMDRLFIRRKKGSLCGEVVLVAACARALRLWIRQRGSRPGPLFVTRQGTGISRSRVFALMVRYGQTAGLAPAKLHPHCLKHAAAIHLANYRKESILDIRSHLGHSSINSTMRYIQMLDQAGEERAPFD